MRSRADDSSKAVMTDGFKTERATQRASLAKGVKATKQRPSLKRGSGNNKSLATGAKTPGGSNPSMPGKRGSTSGRSMATSNRGGSISTRTSFGRSFRSGAPGSEKTGVSGRVNVIMMGQQRAKDDEGGKMSPLMMFGIVCCVIVIVVVLIVAITCGLVFGLPSSNKGETTKVNVNVGGDGDGTMTKVDTGGGGGVQPQVPPRPQPVLVPSTTTVATTTFKVPNWCGDVKACPNLNAEQKCSEIFAGRRYFFRELTSMYDKEPKTEEIYDKILKECKRLGGKMPEPRNKDDYEFIVAQAKPYSYLKVTGLERKWSESFYVGYNDRVTEGKFVSASTGNDVTSDLLDRIKYKWYKQDPNNAQTTTNGGVGEDCIAGLLNGDGFVDWGCKQEHAGGTDARSALLVCEFECP